MKNALLIALVIWGPVSLSAQNYTSTSDGLWTTASNWGGSAPATSGQSWGTINANHNLTINTDYSFTGATLNVAANKQLIVDGNLSIASGANINVYGTLTLTGNAVLNANLRVYAGGRISVDGNVTVRNSTYLTVGTNTAGPPYADLVIYGNLVSQSSGDVVVNQNGRAAIFGNLTNDGTGGTVFTINNGGQVYIDDNIAFSGGGGDRIVNNNTTSPYGLYVNGNITNSGGGSTTTGNKGDLTTLQNTNVPFYNWVTANGLLPVELVYFRVTENNAYGISLGWATASEKDFGRFIIERSADGKNFHEVGQQRGLNQQGELKKYSFTDINPLLGENYYRLKSLDLDNSYEYSAVVYASYSGSKKVTVYPNPTNGYSFKILANFQPVSSATIEIIDHIGVKILEFTLSDFAGSIEFPNRLNQGNYLIKYTDDEYKQIIRLSVK